MTTTLKVSGLSMGAVLKEVGFEIKKDAYCDSSNELMN